jgi:hypothetical protein
MWTNPRSRTICRNQACRYRNINNFTRKEGPIVECNPEYIQTMVDMGFKKTEAVSALLEVGVYKSDVLQRAIDYLFGTLHEDVDYRGSNSPRKQKSNPKTSSIGMDDGDRKEEVVAIDTNQKGIKKRAAEKTLESSSRSPPMAQPPVIKKKHKSTSSPPLRSVSPISDQADRGSGDEALSLVNIQAKKKLSTAATDVKKKRKAPLTNKATLVNGKRIFRPILVKVETAVSTSPPVSTVSPTAHDGLHRRGEWPQNNARIDDESDIND